MFTDADKQAYSRYLSRVEQELSGCSGIFSYEEIERAASLILDARQRGNRIHISGIGKPGHLAGYIASLMSSTGTPTYFLHGTEAVHGSCGQLVPGDVVIFISNSGETQEMRATVQAIIYNGCHVIGLSGNSNSWLSSHSDVHICAAAVQEGGPLGRAPRMSILMETVALQALSVLLQEHAKVTPQQYVCWHPGGKLGQLRDNEN